MSYRTVATLLLLLVLAASWLWAGNDEGTFSWPFGVPAPPSDTNTVLRGLNIN